MEIEGYYEAPGGFENIFPAKDNGTCGIDADRRDEIIDRYLADEMEAEELEAFEHHIFLCNECASDILRFREAINILRPDNPAPVPSPNPLIFSGFARAAAIVLGVLLVAAFAWEKRYEGQRHEAYLQASAPFERMEYLRTIPKQFRSENAIMIISPADSANFETSWFSFLSDQITFEWQQSNSQPDLTFNLELFDNQGRSLYKAKKLTDKHHLKHTLNAGRYYWKLDQQGKAAYSGDIVHIGVFTVDKPD